SPVWARFSAPGHAGSLSGDAVLQVEVGSPASKARLALSVAPGPPPRARFRAYGCPYTLAVGQWLAETVERDGLQALLQVDARSLRAALEIPEDRAHCALMGEDLVRALRSKLQTT
ncbi:MAG TPA: iron-sulfur cluster assembly scaffold protein, partial [Fontimonas sp.]